jgi:site-specific DNA-methyltransferase (adenine-specific)
MIPAELRLGDCLAPGGLDSIPDRSVEAVITDPPYSKEAHTKGRRVKPTGWQRAGTGTCVTEKPLSFPPMTAQQRDLAAVHFARIATQVIAVFCQVEDVGAWRVALERGGASYKRTVPWVKPDAQPSLHGRWPGQAMEAIVIATKPRARKLPIGGKAWYFVEPRCRDQLHETGKPMRIMRELVLGLTKPGDVVVDPYAGSASTLVACRDLGRRGLGWEIDPACHEIGVRRLAGQEPRPLEFQPSLF